MANDNDMAILAESLSEIREAIERVATAIKLKESSTVVVVNSDERGVSRSRDFTVATITNTNRRRIIASANSNSARAADIACLLAGTGAAASVASRIAGPNSRARWITLDCERSFVF